MNLRNQRRMAAELLKVGENKVNFNQERLEEVADALTREDIRYLINSGAIAAKQEKGQSRGRIRQAKQKRSKGLKTGHGSRKGTAKARYDTKRLWVVKVRALRDELRKMRQEDIVDQSTYRKLYNQIKGGLFHSRRHLREQVERLKR
ncbi:MAG: 50S ribosomal protein L19e [Candidatus Altiarchaeales archaeon]|nr:50S ribosomal protein L19e [Candidatus Altiarchaeales archaeon]